MAVTTRAAAARAVVQVRAENAAKYGESWVVPRSSDPARRRRETPYERFDHGPCGPSRPSVLPGDDADATLRPRMSEAPCRRSRPLSLEELGWSAAFAAHVTEAEAALRPARVASVYSAHVDVWLGGTAVAPRMASLRGRALRDAPEGGVAVGDWALVAPASEGSEDVVVERILPAPDRVRAASRRVSAPSHRPSPRTSTACSSSRRSTETSTRDGSSAISSRSPAAAPRR